MALPILLCPGQRQIVVRGNDGSSWILREPTLIEAIGHPRTGAEGVVSPIVGGNFRLRFTHSKFCNYGNSDSAF
jgi:hypothetical protein